MAAEPWVGTWAAEKPWCANEAGGEDGPIRITRQGYTGVENRCRFTRIRKRGGAWHLDASCVGEGRPYRERYVYRMKGDSLVIAFPQRGQAQIVFHRCR